MDKLERIATDAYIRRYKNQSLHKVPEWILDALRQAAQEARREAFQEVYDKYRGLPYAQGFIAWLESQSTPSGKE